MNSNFDASCTKMILLYFASSIFHLCLSCCVLELCLLFGWTENSSSLKWTQSKSIFHNCTQRYWKYICGWLPSNNLKKFRWETFAKPPSSTFNSNLPWETPWWHPAFRSSCGVAAIVMLGDGSWCWRPGVPWLFGKPWGKHHLNKYLPYIHFTHIETLQMGLSENKVYP